MAAAGSLIPYIFSTYLWSGYYASFRVTDGHLLVPLTLILALLAAAVLRYADALVTAAAFAVLLLLVSVTALQSPWGRPCCLS
ncbi:hypothetical protein [Hymenobacter siberiensis]|uniref:hypothetical protein n=1 Tax=Hymenobacter siberiensis TaxID=2848396 RepID=UPI001C1DF1F3|nr:hypothetical protein [Hymenobacter siberiensis]MBU6119345.1 hypothetical protein [Hymenobacter siberiensis]